LEDTLNQSKGLPQQTKRPAQQIEMPSQQIEKTYHTKWKDVPQQIEGLLQEI